MQFQDWRAEYPALVGILQARLGDKITCDDVVVRYETEMSHIWAFTARFLGDGGTSAVLTRSLQQAIRYAPLLDSLQVQEQAVDFSGLRRLVESPDCNIGEVRDALLRLAVMVISTLADLTGNVLTDSLIDYIERDEQ